MLDCDKILVMGGGNVLEYDTPNNLLKKDFNNDKSAVFAQMYHQSLKHSQK